MDAQKTKPSRIGRLLCAIGLHRWEYNAGGLVMRGGARDSRVCTRCGAYRVWIGGAFRCDALLGLRPGTECRPHRFRE